MEKTNLENLKLAVSQLDSICSFKTSAGIMMHSSLKKEQTGKKNDKFLTLDVFLNELSSKSYCNLDEYKKSREDGIERLVRMMNEESTPLNEIVGQEELLGKDIGVDILYVRTLLRALVLYSGCTETVFEDVDKSLYRISTFYLIMLAKSILFLLQNCDADTYSQERALLGIHQSVDTVVKKITKKATFSSDDFEMIVLCQEVLYLSLVVEKYSKENTLEENWEEAGTYLIAKIVDTVYCKNIHRSLDLVKYSQMALELSNPKERQNIFNILGLSALSAPHGKQFSYDVYYSWIYCQPVGYLSQLQTRSGKSMDSFFSSWNETEWRETDEGKRCCSTMIANMGYVCAEIGDTYERDSQQFKGFYNLAKKYFETGLNTYKSIELLCSSSVIYSDEDLPFLSYEKAIDMLRSAYRMETEPKDKLERLNEMCKITLESLFSDFADSCTETDQVEGWIKGKELHFNELVARIQIKQKILLGSEALDSKFETLFEIERLHRECNDTKLNLELLMLAQLAKAIKSALRRNEYCSDEFLTRESPDEPVVPPKRKKSHPIACYTTLKTASYYFDVMYRNDKTRAPRKIDTEKCEELKYSQEYKDGINCLTLMHACYMNDPNEGMALSSTIAKRNPADDLIFYHGNAEKFRESIYEKNFVFLKSFCSKVDNLLMWNRYGSDRGFGSKDSNGCYIQFNSDFFDQVNGSSEYKKNKMLDEADDYSLYRVLYISPENGNLTDKNNPGIDAKIKIYYKLLLSLLDEINKHLQRVKGKKLKIARDSIEVSLSGILFLFKYDNYADEDELRLIEVRTHDDIDCINLVGDNPKMLCINPYFQIAIDKITLGPNVSNSNAWSNYFHYQLVNMWKRALKTENISQIPPFIIDRSKIDYRT